MKPIITAMEIKMSQDFAEYKKGIWIPARPIVLASLWQRAVAAFGVLNKKYDAVDWQDGPRRKDENYNESKRNP